jgi:hypothetical protein
MAFAVNREKSERRRGLFFLWHSRVRAAGDDPISTSRVKKVDAASSLQIRSSSCPPPAAGRRSGEFPKCCPAGEGTLSCYGHAVRSSPTTVLFSR